MAQPLTCHPTCHWGQVAAVISHVEHAHVNSEWDPFAVVHGVV